LLSKGPYFGPFAFEPAPHDIPYAESHLIKNL